MTYLVLLIAGVIGLLAMAAMGFAHTGHGHGHHHHDAHGHSEGHGAHGHEAHGHGHHAQHGHAHHAHHAHGHHGHGHHDNANADGDADGDGDGAAVGGPSVLVKLLPFLSPLNWFSWFIGAGAAGLVAGRLGLQEPFAAAAAVGGALAFNLGVVKPIWKVVFSFASEPAGNLEGCILQTVEAVTPFNERGEGLVRVLVDGRSDDVLARLTPEARQSGERVRRGERLLIEEVDASTGTLRVSRA